MGAVDPYDYQHSLRHSAVRTAHVGQKCRLDEYFQPTYMKLLVEGLRDHDVVPFMDDQSFHLENGEAIKSDTILSSKRTVPLPAV